MSTTIVRGLATKELTLRFEAICGNVDEAHALLKAALEKKLETIAWARHDPDFESLRTDPRFVEMVGATDTNG